jgi:hemolysin III
MENDTLQKIYVQEFSRGHELANIFIHVLGILFGVIAVPFLISLAAQNHDTSRIISIAVYGVCFLMLFTCSTSYHACKTQRMRCLFHKLDRISIYFLIAGTYTPVIRFYLFDNTGIFLLIVLWALVALGTFFEIFFPRKFNIFSTMFYVLMGWICVFVWGHFFSPIPPDITALIIAGMVVYSVGVIFYLWQKIKYHHAIWHAFVLTGGICHFIAVLNTVA